MVRLGNFAIAAKSEDFYITSDKDLTLCSVDFAAIAEVSDHTIGRSEGVTEFGDRTVF